MRLLVLEDEPHWQATISSIVVADPARILTMCANLTDALSAIKAIDFDIFIVDLGLPDGNGIDAIRTSRRLRPDADMVATVFDDEKSVVSRDLRRRHRLSRQGQHRRGMGHGDRGFARRTFTVDAEDRPPYPATAAGARARPPLGVRSRRRASLRVSVSTADENVLSRARSRCCDSSRRDFRWSR